MKWCFKWVWSCFDLTSFSVFTCRMVQTGVFLTVLIWLLSLSLCRMVAVVFSWTRTPRSTGCLSWMDYRGCCCSQRISPWPLMRKRLIHCPEGMQKFVDCWMIWMCFWLKEEMSGYFTVLLLAGYFIQRFWRIAASTKSTTLTLGCPEWMQNC